MPSLKDLVGLPAKALRSMVFSRGRNPWRMSFLPGTRISYEREVGDGTSSDIVMGNIHWLMTTIQEPPLLIARRDADGMDEPLDQHALLDLLEMPNPYYDFGLLMAATELSYAVDGNAYWLLIRSAAGRVVEIWWAPHWTMEPCRAVSSEAFISHYEYQPEGRAKMMIDPEDVVHFRFGLDPDNPRKGLSRLKTVLRELYTDAEAANWTSALLRNGAVPSSIISPSASAPVQASQANVEATQRYITANFTGDGRGAPLALAYPTDIKMLGFDPSQMNLRDLRRIPEERACAMLGVPPIITGFGAGLDHATYSNYREAERVVYRANLKPTWETFARTIRRQLLRHFETDLNGLTVYFDLSDIDALQEDASARQQRLSSQFKDGAITLAEYRDAMGWEVEDSHKIFLWPLSLTPIPYDSPEDGVPMPEPMAPEEEPDEDPDADA